MNLLELAEDPAKVAKAAKFAENIMFTLKFWRLTNVSI